MDRNELDSTDDSMPKADGGNAAIWGAQKLGYTKQRMIAAKLFASHSLLLCYIFITTEVSFYATLLNTVFVAMVLNG